MAQQTHPFLLASPVIFKRQIFQQQLVDVAELGYRWEQDRYKTK